MVPGHMHRKVQDNVSSLQEKWHPLLWQSFWNKHSADSSDSGREETSQWTEARAAPRKPGCLAQFAFSFYALKPQGEESEQARFYRKVYVAGSRLLRATIHCFRHFSRSCCSRSQMKSCLAGRQYNQYFKSLNKSMSQYLGVSPFYFSRLQNNLQGSVTTRMSLAHNTRQWLQKVNKQTNPPKNRRKLFKW